jgi:hypothetical protein
MFLSPVAVLLLHDRKFYMRKEKPRWRKLTSKLYDFVKRFYAIFTSLCTAVTLDETRERTSVSWMHNPCSSHVDSSQIWGPASDWTVLYLNNEAISLVN